MSIFCLITNRPIRSLFGLVAIALLFHSNLYGTTYYAVVDFGYLHDASTWSLTRGGSGGAGVPGPDDDIFLDGHPIGVEQNDIVRNVYVDYATTQSLYLFSNFTIEGTLLGYKFSSGQSGSPFFVTAAEIIVSSGGTLIFTGNKLNTAQSMVNNQIIAYWSESSPIQVPIIFDLGTNTGTIDQIGRRVGFTVTYEPLELSSPSITLKSGTLEIPSTSSITGLKISNPSATFTINPGATFNYNLPITRDGTTSSKVNNVILNGTMASNSSSYFNIDNFTMGNGAIFNLRFNGPNQTEGFWYQNTTPSTLSFDPNSTINYNIIAGQVIFTSGTSSPFGNITLSGGGTKNLQSTNTLVLKGKLEIASSVTFNSNNNPNSIDIQGQLQNDGAWEPTQTIRMSGNGTAQTVSGNNPINFSGEFIVGRSDTKPSSVVTISSPMTFNGNVTVQENATLILNENLAFNGSLINKGTVSESANETITFSGPVAEIGGTNASRFANLAISGGVSLNQDITLTGNLSVTGSIAPGTSTLTFSSATKSQSITSPTTINIYNLTVNNTTAGGLVVESNVNLLNTLTLNTNSRFDANGASNNKVFTFISDQYNTSRVGPIGNGAIFNGNVTMQRRISGTSAGWRFLTSPIKNNTLTDWSDDFKVQVSPGYENVSYYDEALGSDASNGSDGWTYLKSLNENISNRGVKAYFYSSNFTSGNVTVDNTGLPFIGNGQDNAISAAGEPYTINLDYTASAFDGGGWNLIANPYPCEINWEPGNNLTLTNVNDAIYIYDPINSRYASYVAGINNGATQHIASGQSFFVRANNTGASIQMNENTKAISAGNTFIRTGEIDNLLYVEISNPKGRFDQTAIRFTEVSTENFDPKYDAYKIKSGWINISTISQDSVLLSINSNGKFEGAKFIKVNISPYEFGQYTLKFRGLGSFKTNSVFYLTDHYLNKSILITDGLNYTFDVIEAMAETYGNGRFEIVSLAPIIVKSGPQKILSGDLVKVPIKVGNFKDIHALNFSISWDKYLFQFEKLDNFKLDGPGLHNVDLSNVNEGSIGFNWTASSGYTQLPDDSIIFNLYLQSIGFEQQTDIKLDGQTNAYAATIGGYELNVIGQNAYIDIEPSKVIMGEIRDFYKNPIPNANITLGDSPVPSFYGKENGSYSLISPVVGKSQLSVTKSDETKKNAGVTTYDILIAKRHLLGIETFKNSYQYIAADMDLNKDFTAIDIIKLTKAVLGFNDAFPSNNWVIVSENFDISTNPYQYGTSVEIDVTDSLIKRNFLGIKLGDLNNSWANSTRREGPPSKNFEIKKKITDHKQLIVEIFCENYMKLSGYQFTLNWDNKLLKYNHVKEGTNLLNDQYTNEGKLSALWYNEQGQYSDFDKSSPIATFVFDIAPSSNNDYGLYFSNDIVPSLAYDNYLNEYTIQNIEQDLNVVGPNNSLEHQISISPNPAKSYINVSISSEKNVNISINLYDIKGKLVQTLHRPVIIGDNNIHVKLNKNFVPGVYICRINLFGDTITKKLTIKQ